MSFKKKYAVALSDVGSCVAVWKWLQLVRQVRPCAVALMKEPAVTLTPTGCRIIGILPSAFSLFEMEVCCLCDSDEQ